jgi:hypothetical protein
MLVVAQFTGSSGNPGDTGAQFSINPFGTWALTLNNIKHKAIERAFFFIVLIF